MAEPIPVLGVRFFGPHGREYWFQATNVYEFRERFSWPCRVLYDVPYWSGDAMDEYDRRCALLYLSSGCGARQFVLDSERSQS